MRSRFRLAASAAAVSLAAFGAVGVSTSPAAAASATCFGYTGNFNEYGADFVDWQYGPDECFGVAPSGSIWHTWSGAGGWKEMPGNGKALATVAYFESSAGKAVKVVTEAGNYYCNYDDYATNTWGGWYGTTTDHC
ncbi:hypothetical protein ABZX77_22440 [Streptomyces sp. NPDC004237]|uniref:hypothetical protein n=1 Tax=Streptomyces sp. NPDC004237 TaxID=3154455 RepID=UPI0033B18A07